MDLSNKTYLELLDLRKDVNEALSEYSNRQKTKVYSNFTELNGWEHYLNEDNARQAILDEIAEGIYSDDEYKIKCHYLNDAELTFCKDYSTHFKPKE